MVNGVLTAPLVMTVWKIKVGRNVNLVVNVTCLYIAWPKTLQRQEKIYQHFCSIWRPNAHFAHQRVAYGTDLGVAYCRI